MKQSVNLQTVMICIITTTHSIKVKTKCFPSDNRIKMNRLALRFVTEITQTCQQEFGK